MTRNAERERLERQRQGSHAWDLWGPYLAERAWGARPGRRQRRWQGLDAAHQTGWTGLLANLVMRRYQEDVTPWSGLDAGQEASWVDELA